MGVAASGPQEYEIYVFQENGKWRGRVGLPGGGVYHGTEEYLTGAAARAAMAEIVQQLQAAPPEPEPVAASAAEVLRNLRRR